VGEVTKPFKSPNGFHILKINEKKGMVKKKVLIKQTKLRHIIIKQNAITPEEEILKRLNRFKNLIIDGSKTFEDLAKEYSEDGSAANGGDLGWLSPGTTLPIFENTYELLDINEISEPINTTLGWHIIQVTDRRENDLTDESIKYSARIQLVNQKTELIFKDWIKQLRDQSFVDIRLIQD
jgi:peptidyl-prolyl cis-trans isomerase SurA